MTEWKHDSIYVIWRSIPYYSVTFDPKVDKNQLVNSTETDIKRIERVDFNYLFYYNWGKS